MASGKTQPKERELITRAELARRLSVTQQAIRYHAKRGRLVLDESTGKVWWPASMYRIQAMTKQTAAQPPSAPGVNVDDDAADETELPPAAKTIADHELEYKRWRAARERLSYLKARRLMVRRQDVARTINTITSEFLESWLSFPTRNGARIAARFGVSERAVITLLTELIKEHLAEQATADDCTDRVLHAVDRGAAEEEGEEEEDAEDVAS